MSYAARQRRALRYDRINLTIARPFRREIVLIKNLYIDAQIKSWRETGGLSSSLTTKLAYDMEVIFQKYQGKVIRLSAIETQKQLDLPKARAPLEIKYNLWERYLRIWVGKNGGSRARETAFTTQADLKRLIDRAFENGEDEQRVIAAALKAKQLSAFRADTIARTETHAAATFAAQMTVQDMAAEVGVTTVKTWAPVIDERTRPDHAAMEGQPAIGMSESFNVGGVMMDRPGDPSAPAEQVINCRCVCLYDVSD